MKKTLSLNGHWKLAGFDEGMGNWAHPSSLLPSDVEEIDAEVPGEVHVDLLRAGVIPDPYFGINAEEVQWIEDKEWWYKRYFDIEEDFIQQRTYLEFDGLDTYSTIYLNGRELGQTDNMFTPFCFDVSEFIKVGQNTIAVKFAPAAKVLQRIDHSYLAGCFNTPRLNGRKMQCAFGWDWTNRLVGAGIWRDVKLVSYNDVSISDIYIDPEIVGSYADAWITVKVNNHSHKNVKVSASVVLSLGDNQEKIELTEDISPFGGIIEAVIRIEDPELWWPNGMGEQTLYTCNVGLQADGEIMDVGQQQFGIRSIGIVERDQEGGNVFTFLINGEEVFCKGANWVPADHFISNVEADRYQNLLQLAKDANFNMLRVWGGGVYEKPEFYEYCDQMGIMVWQDFMFSCGTYPDNEDFSAKIAKETEVIVQQLRNHPSIVLWCGNNECEMGFPPDKNWQGKKIFHEIIPNTLKRFDHSRPYRVSSPFGGSTGNDNTEGDWHGGSWFDVYLSGHTKWKKIIEKEHAPFISEFYSQSPPMAESLRKFMPEDKLFPPDNEVWEYHNKDNPHSGRTDGLSHQQIMVNLTERIMGQTDSIEQFTAYSGILHGEFLKAEIEHYRREKWAISGALFWMYNDCWPAVSWSIVDYYQRPKIAYYYTKRAFAPVIVSFKEIDNRVQLYVTSDQRIKDTDGVLQVGVLTFGEPEFNTQPVPFTLTSNTSQAFWESDDLSGLITDPARQCLVAILFSHGQMLAKAVYFAKPFTEIDFPKPKLLIQREQVDEKRHKMLIAADAYARNVSIDNLPEASKPSDNYFDLLPGEQYEVFIDNLTVEQANKIAINVWRK